MAKNTNLMKCFAAQAASEALGAKAQEMAIYGRVNEVYADLWAALGTPLIAKNNKGPSPKGAYAALIEISTGDAPKKTLKVTTEDNITGTASTIPAGLLAPGAGWPEVVQVLHAYVGMLADAGACPAPCALPTWADPVVIAAAKAAAAEKRRATKAAKAAVATTGDTDTDTDTDIPAPALTPVIAANFLLAVLKADNNALPSSLGETLYAALHARYAGTLESVTA